MTAKTQTKAAKKPGKQGTSKEAAEIRRKIFVEAYIANGGNGKQAAIKAGFSEKTAESQASRLLRDVKVKDAIAQRAEKTAKKYELTTDLVVKSIVQELTFDPAKLYQAGGQLKDITELDEDTRMALASVEFEQMGSQDAPVFVRKYKWAARQGAREQAMKHLGMFEKDNEQKASALAGLPRELVEAVAAKLRAMA